MHILFWCKQRFLVGMGNVFLFLSLTLTLGVTGQKSAHLVWTASCSAVVLPRPASHDPMTLYYASTSPRKFGSFSNRHAWAVRKILHDCTAQTIRRKSNTPQNSQTRSSSTTYTNRAQVMFLTRRSLRAISMRRSYIPGTSRGRRMERTARPFVTSCMLVHPCMLHEACRY